MAIPDGAVPLAIVRPDPRPCKHVRRFNEVVDEQSNMNNPDDKRGGTLYVGKTWELAMGTSGTQAYRVWLEPIA